MTEADKAGLYIHIPFCKTKCPYCDFYSVPSPSLIPDWLKAVQKEAVMVKGRFSGFDSLYLGGGTPSILTDNELSELVHILFTHFSFSPDIEFTIEANPDDVTPEKLVLFKDLGVNRLSLGVQSLDDEDLLFLKRRHSALQAERALEWIRNAGFENVSVDLMYGLPGQTLSRWLDILKRAAAFRPEHLSCYQITIAEGTPFSRMMAEGKIVPLPEQKEKQFFLRTSTFLETAGYIHYEISSFAAGADRACRHNLKYWRGAPYLGLGPSAHSYLDGARWWNLRDIEGYCRALAQGNPPVAGTERLSEEQLYLEALMLGFRIRDGVDLEVIRNRPNGDRILRDLKKAGLVRLEAGRVFPTRKGFLVADSLPLLFSS
ncbi:MAG: radical SAM family heme chaperone HemW [Pseudomonadota bacterium]